MKTLNPANPANSGALPVSQQRYVATAIITIPELTGYGSAESFFSSFPLKKAVTEDQIAVSVNFYGFVAYWAQLDYRIASITIDDNNVCTVYISIFNSGSYTVPSSTFRVSIVY